MFHIKICGVRQTGDVDAVAAAGGDAIGLNFFPKSVRFADPFASTTRELAQHAGGLGLVRVGVFVNEPATTIQQIASTIGLDRIQLHGDEELKVAASLIREGASVIRAIKLPAEPCDSHSIAELISPWLDIGCDLLLDADAGADHGGSGRTTDWGSIRRWANIHPDVSWSLAGGLTPDNVASAIRTSGARSVDVASGVEEIRGTKSPALIKQFIRSAAAALSQ